MSQDIAKLSRELRFIEDSLKSGIISKSEYDAAKKRVEDKLAVLKAEESAKAEKLAAARPVEQPVKKDTVPKEQKVEFYYHEEPKPALARPSIKESFAKELSAKEEIKPKPQIGTNSNLPNVKLKTYRRKFPLVVPVVMITAAVVVLIIIISMGQFKFGNNVEEKFVPVCSADLDCQMQGHIGTCINPGTKNANCTYERENPVTITILTSKECTFCDIERMENTLTMLYQGASFVVLDASDSQAKNLISKFNLTSLPAYIFDSAVAQTKRFNSNTSPTKDTMEKFGDSYIMKPEAAGSNYFFKDEEEKNNVLFFFNPLSSTSIKAYNNLIDFSKDHPTDISIHYYSRQTAGADELREISRELCIRSYGHEKLVSYLSCMDGRFTEDNALKCLDASISKSKVEECIETDAQKLLDIDNELAKHYYINTLPVFIFNNQYKKGGSLSVDILEESYCKVNPGNCE